MVMSPIWQAGLLSGAVADPDETIRRGLLDHGGRETSGRPTPQVASGGLGLGGAYSPGRQGWLSALGPLVDAFVPGAGLLAGAVNAGLGLHAASQQMGLLDKPMSFADAVYAGTGMDIFGSANRYGRGGYGDLGVRGGYAGALDMADPGVMGAARAYAASDVAAQAIGKAIGPYGADKNGGQGKGSAQSRDAKSGSGGRHGRGNTRGGASGF